MDILSGLLSGLKVPAKVEPASQMPFKRHMVVTDGLPAAV